MEVYNKLVRDNIPDIIKSNGEVPYTKVLNNEEFKKALEDKLLEEYQEVILATGESRLEELADMLEVIAALSKEEDSSLEEVMDIMVRKREKRGGFSKRIFLTKVE